MEADLWKEVTEVIGDLDTCLGTDWENRTTDINQQILEKRLRWHLENILDATTKMKVLLLKLKAESLHSNEKESLVESNDSPALVETKGRDRGCNLMMFGHWHARKNYNKEVVDVLDFLDIHALVKNIEIVRTKEFSPDGKVILRVSFDSPQPITEALTAAKRLKRYTKHKVFLAKDLDYLERLAQRSLVRKLRDKIKHQPEYHWSIQDSEVVSLGIRKVGKRSAESVTSNQSDSPSSTDGDSDTNDFDLHDYGEKNYVDLEVDDLVDTVKRNCLGHMRRRIFISGGSSDLTNDGTE